MATVAVTIPSVRRRPRRRPERVAGRSSLTDIYFLKRIDNSRLRREVDREKRRECFGVLGLGVLVFLFVLLISWQHFQCVRYGYQIEEVRSQRGALEEWNHQLRLQQASLADPQRIDTLARKELGFASPNAQQVIRLKGVAPNPSELSAPEYARNFPPLGQVAHEP
jgi:cell division protein FtsL